MDRGPKVPIVEFFVSAGLALVLSNAVAAETRSTGQAILELHTWPGWVEDWAYIRSLGELWMATPGGLVRFRMADKKYLPTMTILSGLPGNNLTNVMELRGTGCAATRHGDRGWYGLDPDSGRFVKLRAQVTKKIGKGEIHCPGRNERYRFPVIRAGQELGEVTFEDGAWIGSVRVVQTKELVDETQKGRPEYVREIATVLSISSAGTRLRDVWKLADGDFERIYRAFAAGKGEVLVLTSIRRRARGWKEALYRVNAKGWSSPLLLTKLSGVLVDDKEIWLIGARGTVHRISRSGGARLETHPRSQTLLRSFSIVDMAMTPRGLFFTDRPLTPWGGGLTWYDTRNGAFTHYRGHIAKEYQRYFYTVPGEYELPADYRPNTPLPCGCLSDLAWDGKRLWVVAGQEPIALSEIFTVDFMGLFSFDGKEWRDWKVKALHVLCHGNEVWYYVPEGWSDAENRPCWYVLSEDTGLTPRPFEGNDWIAAKKLADYVSEAVVNKSFAAFGIPCQDPPQVRVGIYDRRAKSWKEILPAKGDAWVWPLLLEDDDTLWLRRAKGLERINLRTGKRKWFDVRPGTLARYGEYLLVGHSHLGALHLTTGRYRELYDLDALHSEISCMCVDGDALWVGTEYGIGGGLIKLSLPALLKR